MTQTGLFSVFKKIGILAKLGRELQARAALDPLPKLQVWVVTWPLLSFLKRYLVQLLPQDMNLTTAVVTVLTRCQALELSTCEVSFNPQPHELDTNIPIL